MFLIEPSFWEIIIKKISQEPLFHSYRRFYWSADLRLCLSACVEAEKMDQEYENTNPNQFICLIGQCILMFMN